MDKDRIFIATFSENSRVQAQRYGFGLELNHLCISENLNEENRRNTIEEMAEAQAGRCSVVHGPFTELIPCAIDERARDLAMSRHLESVDICKRLGVNRLVLHSGWIPSMYFPSWQVDKSVRYWKELADKAGIDEDFTICIENVFEPGPDTLIEIIDRVQDPRIWICLDVGHANAVTTDGRVEEWIEKMGERIAHFHLHNNDGTGDSHGELTEGNMDMERILKLAERHSPAATYTIESRKCEKSASWISEYMMKQKISKGDRI